MIPTPSWTPGKYIVRHWRKGKGRGLRRDRKGFRGMYPLMNLTSCLSEESRVISTETSSDLIFSTINRSVNSIFHNLIIQRSK